MTTIDSILNEIGISNNNENYHTLCDNSWKSKIPIRFYKGLIEIKPHSFILLENKIITLFFTFSQNDKTNLSDLFKKIWNLGGTPAVFIISDTTVDIYNGFSFDTKTSCFDKYKIGNTELSLKNLGNNFSIWDLITGKSFEDVKPPKAQIDEKLLENLENTKNILEKNGLADIYTQNLIGRLLFSRYLLDRGVKIDPKYFKDKQSFLELIKNKNLLYKYFNYLKKTFNGDLFPVNDEEIEQVQESHLYYLYELFSSSDITEGTIQKSLFDMYDFNIIPIELISEVYERFIGKKKQKKNAAYYTPAFLVDYILEKTVKTHLLENKNCKVFDPSCGSGIFLVESLRAIIEKNLNKNGSITKEKLTDLLLANIYGVDIDESAVNLTVFSLCLTLLDYINPKDITTYKFPNLLNKNLFVSDFFNIEDIFNKITKNLDFIIGNPPWGSDKGNKNQHIDYFQKINLPISDKQIAQTFVLRTKDFSDKKTKCAFVLPSKPILYNHNAQEFRKCFLKQFNVKEILELSPVRHQLFAGAVAPTSIIFFDYSHKKNTEKNTVLHTSIKPNIFLEYLKLIVIEKNDIKQIKQEFFLKYDYLWKIMLYGNILDFHLIKRLKDQYDCLNNVIKKNDFSYSLGFQVGGKSNPASHLLGKSFIDTKNNALSKFNINDNACKKWSIDEVHRPRTKEVYQPPYVLIKRAFDKRSFSLHAVYSEKEYVFSNLITAVKGNDKRLLKSIVGLINSKTYSYMLLLQGTSAGIEREESYNEERFQFPFVSNANIPKKVDKIQNLYHKLNSVLMYNSDLEMQINSEEAKLNEMILDTFELSNIEKLLIDYAIHITIPQINNQKEPIAKTSEQQLKKYAKVFYSHFGKRWNDNPNFFEIDIYYNDFIIGMNFKVTNIKPKSKIKLYKNKSYDELFRLMQFGEEKITDVFFKQRDIRGFNKASFYVVKPNQYKNWHPAVAHGDLSEFIEAMLKAERSNA